jgi:hypothetical protein
VLATRTCNYCCYALPLVDDIIIIIIAATFTAVSVANAGSVSVSVLLSLSQILLLCDSHYVCQQRALHHIGAQANVHAQGIIIHG